MKTKTCYKCFKTKSLTREYFYKETKTKDGFQNQCKECKKELDSIYRGKSPVYKQYTKSSSFVFSQLKYQAKKRNIQFDLDKDYYTYKLANASCLYCGEMDTKHWIDRFDNNIGYTHKNSVACCETCNKMKMAMGPNEFFKHCNKIEKFK